MDINKTIESFYGMVKPQIASIIRGGFKVVAGYFGTIGLFKASGSQDQFIDMGTAIVLYLIGQGWSWWQASGQDLVKAQIEIIQAKTFAQAQKLRLAGLPQVTVKEIAQQSNLTLAETAKVIPTLPAEVQANIAPATLNPTIITAAKVGTAILLALMIGSLWPDPASAQIKTPAQVKQEIDNFNSRAAAAVTGQPAKQAAVLQDVMSALAKPFQDLADFIAGDADGAATLATLIPGLQDVNGKACWVKMQNAGAVFKAHPVPLTLKLITDFEALRLLQMTANDLCSYTPCTVVSSDTANLVTGVASAVGGALASSLQIPSLTTLCSRIPQIAPQLPTAVTGLTASSPTPAASQSTPAPSQSTTSAPTDTAPATTPAPAKP